MTTRTRFERALGRGLIPFNPASSEHRAIVTAAMAAADAFGVGRLSAAAEQLAFNDIRVDDRDQLARYVYAWGADMDAAFEAANKGKSDE